MKQRTRKVIPVVVLGAVAIGLLAVVGPTAVAKVMGSTEPVDATSSESAPAPSATPSPSATRRPGQVVSCPSGGQVVRTAEQLQDALGSAAPGSVIQLAPGVYRGAFVARAKGTADSPIFLCGSPQSILDAGDPDHQYVLHLDGADHWRVLGFGVRNGQKGVVADHVTGTVIQGLTISGIGDEAIHLRASSTKNIVTGNTITGTGLHSEKYGEGVYIGSAKSNWCRISDCEPDRSDDNQVLDNHISGTTSEAVDIKEGTSSGVLRGNTFNGSSITDADSWVDVKGNDWLIQGNTGTHAPEDGFQTHEIVDGWGTRNRFVDNTSDVDSSGLAIASRPALENVVACSNTEQGAGDGLSNIPCTGSKKP